MILPETDTRILMTHDFPTRPGLYLGIATPPCGNRLSGLLAIGKSYVSDSWNIGEEKLKADRTTLYSLNPLIAGEMLAEAYRQGHLDGGGDFMKATEHMNASWVGRRVKEVEGA